MFGLNFKAEPRFQAVEKAKNDAQQLTIRRAAFRISRFAKGLIKKSDQPSAPGSPPNTRAERGHNLRGAIFVAAEKDNAIIGPRHAWVGDVGEAHEFGKSRKGDDFAERSFMGPALEANLADFAADWRGSIGE